MAISRATCLGSNDLKISWATIFRAHAGRLPAALPASFFALLYFVVAGGASAFRETCRAKRQSTSTSTPAGPAANDNDFFKMQDVEPDAVSYHSRRSKSSSFYSLSPFSPGLHRMRIDGIVQERTPTRVVAFGAVGANADTSGSVQRRGGRLHSDIEGSQVPDGAGLLNSD